MSDVRALLKAKRQEARINHPYASYNTSGQLKCTICASVVKHASAWEGHLGSKIHRTNVIRLREEEKRQLEKRQQEEEAEKEDEEEDEEEEGIQTEAPVTEPPRKRKADSEDDLLKNQADKKRKTENHPKGFPSDFFSDPSRAPALLSDDEDEDGDEPISRQDSALPEAPKDAVDLEYERFQRELMSAPDPTEAYNRATVVAEPVVVSTIVSGFPDTEPEPAGPADLTEEEKHKKHDQEERELIMDRLLEEERAQEDADTRVLLLKNKVEMLRRKRLEAKAKKSKGIA